MYWKDPMSYTIAVIIQTIITMVILFAILATIIYQMTSVLMLISMTEDIKCDLHSIDDKAKSKKHQLEVVKQFTELLPFHSNAKKLSTLN